MTGPDRAQPQDDPQGRVPSDPHASDRPAPPAGASDVEAGADPDDEYEPL